ncbi:MAG: hypothetical protein IJ840_03080 [Bacteroidales bacterium]|nr:hypothetical protein [Bacteroidales bacterium]
MRHCFYSFIVFTAVIISSCGSGSRVKYADRFGFLPGNDPLSNSEALQRCLDGGGVVKVRKPGVYGVCKTIFLDSDTNLEFAEGVVLRRAMGPDSTFARYVFLNRGGLTREYDENISVRGLNIKCDGLERGNDIPPIVGMICQVGFFYVKNLEIKDFTILDLPKHDFGIQICSFENALVENVRIEGMKDAVHFGPGKGFTVRHGVFKTYDDPIALNAQDYTNSNPEMGWIEDGLIEDCIELDDPEHGTTGFFARLLGGGWRDWESGMSIQSSGDAVVSEGRIYRSNGPTEKKSYTSTDRPSHMSGTVTYPDGITWTMSQDRNICHSCGVRNVTFRDIRLGKKRPVAFCLHYDHDQFSRSYYPHSEIPVMGNIVFERVTVENEIPVLIQCRPAADSLILRDCRLGSSRIRILEAIDAPGMRYDTTLVRLEGIVCDDPASLVDAPARPVKVLMD